MQIYFSNSNKYFINNKNHNNKSNGTLQSLLTVKIAENKTDNWIDLLPNICYATDINDQNPLLF